MNKKAVLTLMVAAVTGVSSISGCSRGETGQTHNMSVTFANYNESTPFFQVIRTTLQAQDPSAHGVDVSWLDNKGDPSVMLQNVQQAITEQPNAMVLYPVSNATEGVSRLIEDSGIPCVALNLDVSACKFLNIDNGALGSSSAEIVGRIAQQRGWDASNTTVLIGQNAASGEQVNAAVTHFYSTISTVLGFTPAPASSITAKTTSIGANGIQFDGRSTMQPSFAAVQALLASIPNDRNIILYTVNNDSTMGALRALEDAGRADASHLLIAGLGGDKTGLQALRTDPRWVAEGDVFVSYWGEYAVGMAQALADGAVPPAKVTPLPQVVLTKDALATYHPDGTTAVSKLPALVPDNEFLKDSELIMELNNIAGLT